MSTPLLLRRCRLVDPARTHEGLVDVLLDGGVVASVAPSTTTTASGSEQVLDLEGRWLLPGLWDEHVHLGQWALVRRRLDVSGAASAAEAAAAVGARAAAERDGAAAAGVLVGYGFRDGLWPHAPSAELLDDAVAAAGDPRRPVVLVSADLHCAWLSTAAAQEVAAPLGVVPDTTGLVREEAAFAVQRALGRVGQAELDAAVADALAEAAARGVVGVVDLEMTDALGGTAAVWARRAGAAGAAASAGLRVEAGTYPQHLQEALAAGVRGGQPLATGQPLVVAGPLKVITDGSLNTRTACCLDPYPGRTGPSSRGDLAWPLEALTALVRRGRAGGLEPAVHAIGDAAVRVALDALAASGGGGRVEHAQLVADDDVARFAALGTTASVQPAHLLDDRDVAEVHWRGRTGRAFPLRALLDAGARLALGSDAPVAALDPWLAVAAAVARTDPGDGSADGSRGTAGGGPRPPWHPEQAITPAEALAASARGRSVVAVGDPADVVALEADPLADGVAASGAARVWLTVVDGRVVHHPPS
ncbi:amidohydrolase family protein [Quadrisphaera sp. KR29]|uniref:amidohydrolase family protein n=1 Tax=Quadrisphaera sp. KR29 TaxID=3461391 RepID=UPI004043AF14